jgi:hypothetical protein
MIDAGFHVQKKLMKLIQRRFLDFWMNTLKFSGCRFPILLLSGEDSRY